MLRNQLIAWLELTCSLLSVSSLLSLRFTLPLGIYHFNYNGLFLFLLIGTLCPSWTCMNFSLIKLRKFSIITFSNRFYIPCSSSCPSGIPIIWILLFFMLPWTSFNSFSFFLSLFFLFLLFLGVFFLPCPPTYWFDPLLLIAWFWFLLLCSSIQKLYSSLPLGSCW